MTDREQYTPGPASGAQVRKDGENWTLILVRELRHSPEQVWQALTDPAQAARVGALRRRQEPGYGWNHGEAHHGGSAHAARVRNNRDASRPSRAARIQVGWLRYAMGTRSRRWRHAPDAVDQHRSPLHRNGCCRVAHLPRCAGSPSQRNTDRPHRWSRRDEVRRLAAAEHRVREAVRRRDARVEGRAQ